MSNCLFCEYQSEDYILENELAFAIFDKYPVNEGHMLIIPKRHFSNYFEVKEQELLAIQKLLKEAKQLLEKEYNPAGYNIGINIGQDAGQTIMHLHLHLIPRYKGDVKEAKGGVRNLKPNLVKY